MTIDIVVQRRQVAARQSFKQISYPMYRFFYLHVRLNLSMTLPNFREWKENLLVAVAHHLPRPEWPEIWVRLTLWIGRLCFSTGLSLGYYAEKS